MSIAAHDREWLVRKAAPIPAEPHYQIAGPYTKDQILQMIRSGQIHRQDEVGRSSGYWIYLHETEEVSRHLGPEILNSIRSAAEPSLAADEDTLTGTARGTPSPATSPSNEHLESIPDLPELDDAADESTGLLTASGRIARAPSPQTTPSPLGSDEKTPPQATAAPKQSTLPRAAQPLPTLQTWGSSPQTPEGRWKIVLLILVVGFAATVWVLLRGFNLR